MKLKTFLLSFFKKKEIPEADLYDFFLKNISEITNASEADNVRCLVEERIKDPLLKSRLMGYWVREVAGKGIKKVEGIIITSN